MASEAESLKSQIQDLLSRDELLQGIPLDSTVEDLELLISAEKGEAWVIHVKKLDDRVIDVIIPQNGGIWELLDRLQHTIEQHEAVAMGKRRISWKYLWKNWQLGHCDGAPLCIPPVGPRPIRNTPLCELGIGNHSIITFVPAPTHRKPKKKFF